MLKQHPNFGKVDMCPISVFTHLESQSINNHYVCGSIIEKKTLNGRFFRRRHLLTLISMNIHRRTNILCSKNFQFMLQRFSTKSIVPNVSLKRQYDGCQN